MPHSPMTNDETFLRPLSSLVPSFPQIFTHLIVVPISKRITASSYSKPVQPMILAKTEKKKKSRAHPTPF